MDDLDNNPGRSEVHAERHRVLSLKKVNEQIELCVYFAQVYFRAVEIPEHLQEDLPKMKSNNSFHKFPPLDQLEEGLGEGQNLITTKGRTLVSQIFNDDLRSLWIKVASVHPKFFYELTKRANMLQNQNSVSFDTIAPIVLDFPIDVEISAAVENYYEMRGEMMKAYDGLYKVFYAKMRRSRIEELVELRSEGHVLSAEDMTEIENEVDQLLDELAR